ncbi:MAG TPA: FecR family protein [Puia sp.]|nr:FecR family protein [Puia sp.]
MEELLGAVRDGASEAPMYETLEAFWRETRWQRPSPDVDSVALYRAVILREGEISRRRRLRRRRMVRYRTVGLAAALALSFAFYLVTVLRRGPSAPAKPVAAASNRFRNDVKPGGNRAVLVLASGRSIVLDSAGAGMLAVQGGMKVIKLNNGQLQYRAAADATADSAPVYNTITTPRGGQYELILQDGTKVWLNSESSLRFPTAFVGKERSVELSGEAFFEVAPHAVNPFKIYMLNQEDSRNRKEIDVLGTSFNVMAYDEEKVVRTTLLEGAIRVGDESRQRVLKPGQQAEWSVGSGETAWSGTAVSGKVGSGAAGPGIAGGAGVTGSNVIRVTDEADVDAAVAWKNGFFSFDRSDIRTIMRQLSRWYDLKVIYSNDARIGKPKVFWGGIQKNLPLSDVLRILEKSGVQFNIDGNNVIVNM